MVTHMKTTVEISDALLTAARKVAEREGSTLRELVEEGLRRVLREKSVRKEFALRRASFRGNGIDPHVSEGSWERTRELIYEGRGG